jgi:hypothetical protein
LAEAAEDTTHVRIGDWSLQLAQDTYVARIAARDFAFDLRFIPTQPFCCRETPASRAKARINNSRAITTASRSSRFRARLPSRATHRRSRASRGSITSGRARCWPRRRSAGTGPVSI